ncbi:MAG: sulfatase-like hydrolase/transferase [Hyphomonadaceae bacterium]|nr:sulfatase-like hydrolase/transferase [Hyphomonadaceae bacterium]
MTSEPETQHPFFALRSHRFYNFAIVITGILIFMFVPLFILTPGQTKQYLNNGRELQVLGDMLILTLVFSAVLGAIYWLFCLIRLRDIGATLVMFVLSWVALSGFLFPLTTAGGMFELRNAATHWPNLIIVTVLSSILAVLSVSRYSKMVQVFMAIFLTISILPTLPRAFSQFEKVDGSANAVQLSADKNLVLVGFDGLPGHMVQDVLSATPSHRQTFKDFIFYENTASTSPATDASLLGIVYGNHDFTKWEEPAPIDWQTLYFNRDDKVNFTTSFKYNIYNKSGTRLAAGQYGKAEQRDELFELYRNVVVRITSNYGVNLMDGIDYIVFPNRQGKFQTTVSGFDRVLESLEVTSDKPSVFYTHFTFSHWPTVIDENCENRKMDKGWFREHQNIDGIHDGAVCGLNKYTEFIAKLKSLGVYDNTTIILLSDHGKPVQYYDTPPHNYKINNGPDMGFDRYQPFLMIKPAGRTADALEISDKHVLLDDLAQTTCNVFEPAGFCEQTPGLNILDDADIAPESFYIHVVKDETSNWMVVDHKAVKLPRGVPLVEAMQASPEIDLTERK